MTTQQEQYPLRDDDDAKTRFNEYKSRDPFPDIPAALLNSADIYDYVRTTGMIYPFDSEKLKSASYEASVGVDCIYWEDDGKKQSVDLSEKGSFDLEPNSIAFVTTREKFRLPDYMAVRFNLTITNVHRGLLLGTGPIVDPGFKGRILIPLHNLTTNKYKFCYEEKLIWLEFTKISPNDHWVNNGRSTESYQGIYIPFPRNKNRKTLDTYLKQPEIRSSIPKALRESKENAEKAEKTLKRFQNVALVGVVALFVTLVLGIGSIVLNVNNITGDMTAKQATTAERVIGLKEEVKSLQMRMADLEEKLGKSVASQHDDPKRTKTETNEKIQ